MTGDRATLLALELIRRQLGGLPGEFARALMDAEATQNLNDAPKPTPARKSDPTQARIDGFDTTLANTANRLAAQGWPKVIQLVNLLLAHVARQALSSGAGPRMIAGPREGTPLPASGTAANAAKGAKTSGATFGSYLDEGAALLRKLRAAVGNRTSRAFGAATSYIGKNAKRLAGKAGDAWKNYRPGRAFMREWGSRAGRGMRAGAARGAKMLGGAAKGAAGGIGKMLTAAISPFAVKLLAVLGQMALLAAVLSNATSGFQLVISSVKLLAASLAPILLPFAFMLAAGLATLSDIIWAELAPNLEKWYKLIVGEAIPTVDALIASFKDLVAAIKWTIDGIKNPTQLFSGKSGSGGEGANGRTGVERTLDMGRSWLSTLPGGNMLNRGLGALGVPTFSDMREQQQRRQAPQSGGSTAPGSRPRTAPPAAPNVAGGDKSAERSALLRKNMQETLKELQMSIGPKASFQGLAQASKSAQLAALNQSPFEAKMLQRMQEAIGALTKVVDNTAKQPQPRHNGE